MESSTTPAGLHTIQRGRRMRPAATSTAAPRKLPAAHHHILVALAAHAQLLVVDELHAHAAVAAAAAARTGAAQRDRRRARAALLVVPGGCSGTGGSRLCERASAVAVAGNRSRSVCKQGIEGCDLLRVHASGRSQPAS